MGAGDLPRCLFTCLTTSYNAAVEGKKTIFSPAEKELQQVLLPVLGLVNRQSMLLPLQKTNIGINFHLSNKLGIMFSRAFTFVGSCL